MKLNLNKTKKTVLALMCLLTVGAVCFGVAAYKSFGASEADTSSFADGSATERLNFLLLGTDREAGLCDVVMLVNVDFATGSATVAQIPRDTYAAYTDRSYKKLNGAYASLGGASQMADFLGEAMGISIDHYVCVDLDTLARVVDAVGGVDVNIPSDMTYSDPDQELYISFKRGVNHLDGALAEKFVRFRASYAEGDLGRIDAQKLFLVALFDKISSQMSPALLIKLVEAVENVETDLAVTDIMSLAIKSTAIKRESIALLTLPGAEATATESGASYYVLSAPATAQIMSDYFGGTGEFDGDRVFLNKRYKSFERIYESFEEYKPLYIDEIAENGVNIQIRG